MARLPRVERDGGRAVTYCGVGLFVAFFVLVPMAQSLSHAAGIPGRPMPAAIGRRRSSAPRPISTTPSRVPPSRAPSALVFAEAFEPLMRLVDAFCVDTVAARRSRQAVMAAR